MKESKTTYAYLIEHMYNPTFQKVWDIAYDFIQKLPSELCDELHESLNRGVDVLDSEPLLQMYIYSFGKMHYAKLMHAFSHIQDRVVNNAQIEIIDYGCGQGLASLCYHDFIKKHNSQQKVKRITLIEPSPLALSRAELLCSHFYPEAEVVAVNKLFDDFIPEDIKVSPEALTLHLFSNILDVDSYNLHNLIQTVSNIPSENNEYVIVSPIHNRHRIQRLKTFATNLGGFVYYEKYLDKRQLDEDRDWTCAVLLCTNIAKKEILESECTRVFDEASSYYKVKKHILNDINGNDLFHRLLACAEFGDMRCQNLLGIWYLKGIDREKDFKSAYKWFKKSADQGYASAFGNLGVLYRDGMGVDKDLSKAAYYFDLGATKNHPNCKYKLGALYLKGSGIYKDQEKAFSLLLESSSQGSIPAKYLLFQCYMNGWGTTKNESKAIKVLKEACKFKHPQSCYVLAIGYKSGELVDKNEQKALKLFKESAQLGFCKAQESLGEIYRIGLLGEKEIPKKSFFWYLKAAEQGSSSAQFYVGYYYANGYGVKKDVKLAFEWYTKAAEQKNSAALNNLAICYEHGRGVEIDLTKAAYYYEESAKLGNVTAQKNLAICYNDGRGVEKSPSKVFYWTLEAARNGDVESHGMIALYHFKGYGTEKDLTKALLWYAKCYFKGIKISSANDAFDLFQKKGDEGDSQAIYIMGKCFQYGVATEKNHDNAFRCFERAAELGHIESLIKINRISSLYDFCSIKGEKKIYKDAYGVKYTEDRKVLIDGGYLKRNEYQIARNTRIICDNAFHCGDVGKLIIPSSVIAIGQNPFAEAGWGRCNIEQIECHSEQFIVSDFSLYTKDKKKLISYFGNASNVIIPDGVEIIGSNAFAGKKGLNEIQFPKSLCSIESAAFKYCMNLMQISLPESVKTIGEQCFYGCESLEEIISLGGIEIISKEAFYGCNINTIIFPRSLKEIDDNAFNSNSNLYSITLPEDVKRIGNSSFAYCSIKQIDLNANLLEIGDFCFFDCPIESITIPSSIKSIGINPFIGAKAIGCMEDCMYASENGLLYAKQSGDLISHFCETEVALYPPITRVNSFAFYNSEVTVIFVSSNIVKVSAWAFYNARKLEKVIWCNSKIKEVPQECFGKCSNITKIDIPSCVESIQKGAFFDCSGLKTIRFLGLKTKANEDIFYRVEEPSIPVFYNALYELTGSTISDSDLIKKDLDTNAFPIIEVIVPVGCSENYSFTTIYDYDTLNARHGMNRRFIVREDENE